MNRFVTVCCNFAFERLKDVPDIDGVCTKCNKPFVGFRSGPAPAEKPRDDRFIHSEYGTMSRPATQKKI